MCKCNNFFLETVNTTPQVLTANAPIVFNNNALINGCISHPVNTPNIILKQRGIYKVDVSVDVTATEAGLIGIQLFDNGVAVPGASASTTAGAGVVNLSFPTIVVVPGVCPIAQNYHNLTVGLTAGGTVSNAILTIVK